MKENGLAETDVEDSIFSNINMRPDHMIACLVEHGLIGKEDATKRLATLPKFFRERDSIKVYFAVSPQSQFFEGYEYSGELYKKYPNQIRMHSIDDADIFGFVCSKRKGEYWIDQDFKRLLDYAKSSNKTLLPIIKDLSLGYEIITIADFNTDLSFKIFGIDDQEPEELEPEVQEPEIVKYGEDIEMQTFSSIPFDPRGDYELCSGAEIISGKMDMIRISFAARVCSILSVDKRIHTYAAENYYKDYTIFQIWSSKGIFRIPESDEKKYHVVVIVKKDNVYIDYKKNIGEIKPDQEVLISGTVSSWPIEGCKMGFVYKKDPLLKLPAVFADMVEINSKYVKYVMSFQTFFEA